MKCVISETEYTMTYTCRSKYVRNKSSDCWHT